MFEKIWKWLKKLNAKKNKLNGKYHHCKLLICMISPSTSLVMTSCWKRHELKTHKITSYCITKGKIDRYYSDDTLVKTRMSKWYAN